MEETKGQITVLTDYISVVKSPMYERSFYAPYNPDDLVRKFGYNKGLDKYQQMKIDDAVKAALYVKKSAIISSGWTIEPASQDELDIQIAKEIEENLRYTMNGSFEESLMQILSALEYGFSATEKIYQTDGKRVLLKELKNKPPQSFEFHTDNFGNLPAEGFKQWLTDGILKSMPLWKFIIFTHNKEMDNWYGDSDLRGAYRSWFSKDIIIKAWNVYLERFGNPLIIGKYENRTASNDERASLQNMINNISVKTSFMLPSDASIEILESTKSAGTEFSNAIDKHNAMIMRSILVPKHLGFDETEGGSYALGKVNLGVFSWVINKIRNELQTCVDEQLIRQMVELNYPNSKTYPRFKFSPLTEEDKSAKSKDIIEGLRSGALTTDIATENYLRGLLGLPAIEEDMEAEEYSVKQARHYKMNRQPNKYEKKVDFAFINKSLTDDVEVGIEKIKEVLRKVRDDFTNQMVRKDVVDSKNIAAIDKLEFKYIRELALEIEGTLRKGYDNGKTSARKTAKEKNYATTSNIGLVKSKANMWIKSQTKILTGDISTNLQSKAKKIILDGVNRGANTNEVVNQINDAFEPYVAEVGFEGSEITGMRLYTEVNTTVAQAFATGLREYNAGLEADGLIVAYEYSAILDNNTTEGCEELDGKVFEITNPYINEIAPPRHWNCRSTLVPIFKDEEYEASEALDVGRDF